MLGYTAAVILVGLCRMKVSTAVYKGKCEAQQLKEGRSSQGNLLGIPAFNHFTARLISVYFKFIHVRFVGSGYDI
ncbi:hypothetical protein GGC63_001733 [Paenibacillus sp. OAS669]|nr:hypothetical protein [Paenibacillus sp. OAS669]